MLAVRPMVMIVRGFDSRTPYGDDSAGLCSMEQVLCSALTLRSTAPRSLKESTIFRRNDKFCDCIANFGITGRVARSGLPSAFVKCSDSWNDVHSLTRSVPMSESDGG